MQHSSERCPLVAARIACLVCGYGFSECRFLDETEYEAYWSSTEGQRELES